MAVQDEQTPVPVNRQMLSPAYKPTVDSIRQQMSVLEKDIDNIIAGIELQSEDALVEALRPIYERSQVLVPVKTGALKESGYLEGEMDGSVARASVGYAQEHDPGYAVFVHENLEARHRAPTQAKFLQQPVEEQMGEIRGRIVDYLRKVMGQD